MPKIFPVTVKRTTVVAGGDADLQWADTAAASDDLGAAVALLDSAAVSDDPAASLELLDSASTTDDFAVNGAVSFPDTARLTDDPLASLWLPDTLRANDDPAASLALPDTFAVDDPLKVTGSAGWPDTARFTESQVWVAQFTDPGRSGTPASDWLQDTRVAQASPTTNFGTGVDNFVIGPATVGPAEIITFFLVDLTTAKLTGLIPAGASAFALRLLISQNNALLASTLNYDIRYHTTKPFIEDAVTWNTKPANTLGTSIKAGTISVAVGAAAFHTITTTGVELTPAIGNWLFIVLTGPAGLVPDQFTIASRENTTTANRPRLTLGFV